jgi:hypothetical protein
MHTQWLDEHDKGELWTEEKFEESREQLLVNPNLDVATRKGVTDITHYRALDIFMYLGPSLHIQMGMGNTIITEFNEFIDEECEPLSLQEESARTTVKHVITMAIKDRTAPELLKAFQIMEQILVARGLTPKLIKLDNEASKLLKTYLHQQDITFQLVPPYSHRRNSAERTIRSFKDHLIAGLCTTDKSFPMHLWDRLLPQAVITLNMLRTSRINPKLSAATHIFGQYDFNRAPDLAPEKCVWYLISHCWKDGKPKLLQKHISHRGIKIVSRSTNTESGVKRKAPTKVHRTLGFFMTGDGTCTSHKKLMKEKASLYTTAITHSSVWKG